MERHDVVYRKLKGPPGLLKKRVLVVDEGSGTHLLHYSAFLQRQGYQVRAISSFVDGAACVEREDFDLVVVSQGSPSFEGRVVLARAIEKNRWVPGSILTRAVDIPCYIEAMQSGARDYVGRSLCPFQK